MQHQPSIFVKAGPLLLVLFIDGMGLGLVIPVLNQLIFDPNSDFLASYHFTPVMHNFIYGLIIGIFMLCWFFGAAILGDLSDQIGRKKSLIICLIGAFLSYVLSAFAVIFHSLALIIIGRVIAGFTAGSQPIAQAAIIDLSTADDKARNIGYILLALSLGFIFGPLLGGILADNHLVSWFSPATPFYFAASISFINIIILKLYFFETFVSRSTTLSINPYQAINIFVSAFKNERVRSLSIIFFVFIFGWSSFYSFISVYLLKVFQFTATQVSLFMAVMGVGFGIGNGFLVNYVASMFTLRESYIYFTVLSALMAFCMVFFNSAILNWLLMAPLACCISTAYACVLTLFSNQVDNKSQGWVMGITGAVMAFVWAVNGVIVGVLAAFNDKLPIYISAASLLIAAVATYSIFNPNANKRNNEMIKH